MSADNWAKCPRCAKQVEDKRRDMQAAAAKAYGKVPAEEWERLMDEANAYDGGLENGGYTFREDYEFWGVEQGEWNVRYRGSCEACGLTFAFDKTEQLSL